MTYRFCRRACLAVVVSLFGLSGGIVLAQSATGDDELRTDILYRTENGLDDYARSRCRLDVYTPKGGRDLPTVVWFHGGGLTGGNKSIPPRLKNQGIVVVTVNYRLSPHVKSPTYVDDAAAAIAWTLDHIGEYGGSPKRVFASGHSAGGYLISMVGLDKRWLAKYGHDPDELMGLIPFSGQVATHFTIRAERGLEPTQLTIDDMAPLGHLRKDAPPMLLILGDRELEIFGRYEENAYFWRMMKVAGHPDVTLLEMQGYNHGAMADPAFPLLVKFIKERSTALSKTTP
ncbi:MAG: alpha/beta hydrolase [Planctomycetaceae bacterium]|nr:alpha/beta hydrolase [Planctomycetaceae bacterium]